MTLPTAPTWFDADRYAPAAKMDRGDWLLNLCVRCRLHHEPDAHLEQSLRELGPVLRRADLFPEKSIGPHGTAQIEAMLRGGPAALSLVEFLDDLEPSHASSSYGIDEARKTGAVKSGVRPVGVSELYWIEGKLPAEVRAYGVENRPLTLKVHRNAPAAYLGTLNDAIAAGVGSHLLGRYVRIDVALPDAVLLADLQLWLTAERERLRQIGGPQPYREGSETRKKPPAASFRALANMQLLPYLDLCRWNDAERVGLSMRALQEMACGSAEDRGAELRNYAALFMHPHHLQAWFALSERRAQRRR
jgi:hypothetical protein